MILRKEQFWSKKRDKKNKDIQLYLISIKDYLTFKFEFCLPNRKQYLKSNNETNHKIS